MKPLLFHLFVRRQPKSKVGCYSESFIYFVTTIVLLSFEYFLPVVIPFYPFFALGVRSLIVALLDSFSRQSLYYST